MMRCKYLSRMWYNNKIIVTVRMSFALLQMWHYTDELKIIYYVMTHTDQDNNVVFDDFTVTSQVMMWLRVYCNTQQTRIDMNWNGFRFAEILIYEY